MVIKEKENPIQSRLRTLLMPNAGSKTTDWGNGLQRAPTNTHACTLSVHTAQGQTHIDNIHMHTSRVKPDLKMSKKNLQPKNS